MPTKEAPEEKRTAAVVLSEIQAKLSTIDSIATSDAFHLGGLIREYGERKASDSLNNFMGHMLGGMKNPHPKDDTDEPWRG